ncbi:MAG: restriction endonuclease subunit S [Magnetococcales bacterium]|nr:restriction endonuclease subunit S [Magnetococcales bacterium]
MTNVVGFGTLTIEEATERLIDYRGKTPPKTNSGVRLVTAKVVKGGQIHDEPAEYIAADFYDEWMRRGLPQKLDVLLTTEAPLGEVAILRNDARIALAQRIILLRARPGLLDPFYLFYALQSDFGQGELKARSSGTTVLGIKQSELRKVRIPFFPLPIQRRIAGILSAYDELIENNQRRIKILETMARSLYREWFVHFRFPGHESVRRVASPLGEIPEGWEVKTLSQIAENFDRFRKPLSKMQRAEMQGEYPYYGAAKVFDYINDFVFDGEYLLMAEDGSVINTERTPVLQLVNEKFWPNNHTHVIRGIRSFSTHFLYLGLSEVDVSPYITGAAQPKITQENMNRIPFYCGPEKLHQRFNRLIEPIIRQNQVLRRQIQNLRRSRDLLLPRLLSGQIDVEAMPHA